MDIDENSGTGLRILWVEDDYYHLKNLTLPLLKRGITVVPARTFLEAKERLRQWQEFSLVLLDLIIPYSDSEILDPSQSNQGTDRVLANNGIDLFRLMVEDLKVSIPIVLLTVVRTTAIVNSLMSHGAAKHVYKSGLIPDELDRIVVDAIKMSLASTNAEVDGEE